MGVFVRANPLALIAVGLAALVGSLFVRSLTTALVVIAVHAALVILGSRSWRFAALCLAFSGLAGLSVAYSTWRLGGHDLELAATAGLRIVVLAWLGSVAAGHLDPARLGDDLGQTLRLPARGVVAFTAALQRFGHLTQTWVALRRTRRVRGLRANPGALAFGLLVDAMRGATRSAIAMDSRGFATAHERTWLVPARWGPADTVWLVVAGVLVVLPAALWVAGVGVGG